MWVALAKWALVLAALGGLAWPWVARLLPAAPARGYAQARLAALLALATAYGWVTIVGRAPNSNATLYAVAAGLAALGLFGWWRHGHEMAATARREWRHLLAVELLMDGMLLAAALYRAAIPAVAHTEQPMDFAFLNAMWQSPHLPPEDPWMAGAPISYYYLGYLAIALPARLAGISAAVAYNLGLAHTAALAAGGLYGAAAGLLDAGRCRAETGAQRRLAMVGALAVILAGSPAGAAALARAVAQGWGAVSGAWWWWPASRPILDLNFLGRDPTVITEFPAFSLLLGDLHPHYMALPLLACGAALLPELARRARARADGAPGGRLGGRAWGCAAALLLGAAGFLNSWDWPTLLGLAVLTYAFYRRRAGTPWLGDTLRVGLWLGALGLAGYAPFYLDLDSQVEGVNLAYHAKTALPAYAQALGIWLWPLLADLGGEWRLLWARRRAVLARWALLALLPWALLLLLGGLGRALLGLAALAAAGPWVTLLQSAMLAALWTLLEAEREADERATPRALGRLLALAGVGLTYLTEYVYVVDLFNTRMNTVFKVYYQAWVLLGLAAFLMLPRLAAGIRQRGRARLPTAIALGISALLLAAGWAYTGAAAGSRVAHEGGAAPTLDATATLADAAPGEAAAYRWLEAHALAGERMVEGVGEDYRVDGNRLSAWSGVPTILGWPGHEAQWRGRAAEAEIDERERDVARIYTSTDEQEVRALLAQYGVTYLYLGPYERERYGIDESRAAWYAGWLAPCVSGGGVWLFRRP